MRVARADLRHAVESGIWKAQLGGSETALKLRRWARETEWAVVGGYWVESPAGQTYCCPMAGTGVYARHVLSKEQLMRRDVEAQALKIGYTFHPDTHHVTVDVRSIPRHQEEAFAVVYDSVMRMWVPKPHNLAFIHDGDDGMLKQLARRAHAR